jgi:hypothetical protein
MRETGRVRVRRVRRVIAKKKVEAPTSTHVIEIAAILAL